MPQASLTEFCVYSIVDGKRLRRLAKEHRTEPFEERKRWVTAHRLWQRATSNKEAMPVVLADATECDRLLFWGILTDVHLTEDGTTYSVDRLRTIRGRHVPQELVLREAGRRIAPHFIRPYALCRTPPFLVKRHAG